MNNNISIEDFVAKIQKFQGVNQKGVIRKLRGKIRFIYDMHFTNMTFYFFSKNYQRKKYWALHGNKWRGQ